jgi:tetratricopeptide (TPR) repeat protein
MLIPGRRRMGNDVEPGQPAGPLPTKPSSRRWIVRALAGLVVLAVVVVVILRWPAGRGSQPTAPAAVADDDLAPSVVLNPGYVGAQACAPCHADRVAEFRQTNHFRACRRPKDGPMPPGFEPGRGTLVARDAPVRFELTRFGDDFVQTAVLTTPAGEQRSTARIGLVFGAGGLDEVNFAWHGDRLSELPVAWIHPINQWGHVSLNRRGTGDFSRDGTTRCQECHNTWFEHVPGTPNQYKPDSFLLGVTCERCHGPGREHIAYHEANPKAAAKAIVHPGHLARERQMEVCTQCHSNAVTPRGPRFSYRPGEPLDDYFRTAITRHPEEDHVANQVKYLRESKCFQKSDTLTCVTCHNPHQPTNHDAVRQSCLKCHEPAACKERPRVPAAVRDDCAGCHTPARVWMNVHFHTADESFVAPIRRTDHRVAVHPESRDRVLLDYYRKQADADGKREAARLTRSLTSYWLAEADSRAKDYRYLAAIGAVREALSVEATLEVRRRLADAVAAQSRVLDELNEGLYQIELKRYPDAIETLTGLLRVKPDYGVARAQLGKAYAGMGDTDRALREWRAATKSDPNDPYGHIMIGWVALLAGRGDAVVEEYRKADAREPHNAEIKFRLGLGLSMLGREAEAADAFRQAAAIDPKHAGGHQRLSDILRKQGRTADAVRHAFRAAKLTNFENADVLMTLAAAYVAADRRRDAELIADKILNVTDRAPPDVRQVIREKLAELRLGPG